MSIKCGMLRIGTGLLAGLLATAGARAAEPCGLCATEIIINDPLAHCFLAQYQQLADKADGAVAVDLSLCEQSRGVVEPLASPHPTAEEPDLRFLITKEQLACLKGKLEQPGLVLDPSARIELDRCG